MFWNTVGVAISFALGLLYAMNRGKKYVEIFSAVHDRINYAVLKKYISKEKFQSKQFS